MIQLTDFPLQINTTSAVARQGRNINILQPTSGSSSQTNYGLWLRPRDLQPSTAEPYHVTEMDFCAELPRDGFPNCGLIIQNSTTGQFLAHHVSTDDTGFHAFTPREYTDSFTELPLVPALTEPITANGILLRVRIVTIATGDVTLYYSLNGGEFYNVLTAPVSNALSGWDHYGFGVNTFQQETPSVMTVERCAEYLAVTVPE
jgi:hypothetical protein